MVWFSDMHNIVFYLMAIFVIIPSPSYASASQAREVARINNCIPKKIEVYNQKIGADTQTVYKVACNMPKVSTSNSAQVANALLVRCNGSLCQMLRPIKD